MVVETYFEKSIPGHVVVLDGIDTAGNQLGFNAEFFIRTGEGGKGKLHLVEALAALLRIVDDFRITERPDSDIDEEEINRIKEMVGMN